MTSGERFAACFWSWFATSFVVFWIVAGIIDGQGRKDNSHTGAVPADVTQLSPSAYLVVNRSVTGQQLCGPYGIDSRNDQNSGPIETKAIRGLKNSVFVQCARNQSWNDHRPKSVNYSAAMKQTITAPLWISIETGVFAFLMFVSPLPKWLEERKRRRRNKREAATREQRDKINAETKRKELRAAYARGEINDLEFEQGLDRVYKILGTTKEDA